MSKAYSTLLAAMFASGGQLPPLRFKQTVDTRPDKLKRRQSENKNSNDSLIQEFFIVKEELGLTTKQLSKRLGIKPARLKDFLSGNADHQDVIEALRRLQDEPS